MRPKQEIQNLIENSNWTKEVSLLYIGKTPRLFNCRLTDDDVKVLCKILLPFALNIVHIDFSNNHLSQAAMEYLHPLLAAALNLVSLNLQYNLIGPVGCNLLLNALVEAKQ